ncbi:hypothetical protein LR392_04760 [Arthrobacter sp. AK04]|uniref:hypothetical protein n=1 Tax=Arthrobacter sp. AK04 TaxID=2900048 RepID=UPI001E42CC99|nr:hypothetical protein [Arthrobacter sp. AK04]MCD5341538.1 hypothetical protein [Arthrobacter sp. AK04]
MLLGLKGSPGIAVLTEQEAAGLAAGHQVSEVCQEHCPLVARRSSASDVEDHGATEETCFRRPDQLVKVLETETQLAPVGLSTKMVRAGFTGMRID